MPPKLYKAADVCDLAQVQPYVLRSWEKEFPGIGVQKSADSPRLYRQSDLDQVLRIKQLVFGEGLTLAGARRRLEQSVAAPPGTATDAEVAEVLDALASDARTRIAYVRDGLKSILKVLSSAPGTVVVVDDFHLAPPPQRGAVKSTAAKSRSAAARVKPQTLASTPRAAKGTAPRAAKGTAPRAATRTKVKRGRANA